MSRRQTAHPSLSKHIISKVGKVCGGVVGVVRRQQHTIAPDYIHNIVMRQAMRRHDIRAYGKVSKVRRGLGKGFIVVALLPLCSLWLLPIGFYLLGLPLRLMVRSRIIRIREGLRLW